MVDLIEISKKMVLSKFEPKNKDEIIIGAYECENYPILIKDLLDEGNIEYNEKEKYVIFKAYFDRKERTCKKERDMVVIMTDISKEKIIFACINILKNCCTNEHEFIKFNLNLKG